MILLELAKGWKGMIAGGVCCCGSTRMEKLFGDHIKA